MRLFPIVSLACLVTLPATPSHAEYSTQAQVFFDADSGQTTRQLVRVVDPDPDLGLAFRWHPAPDNSDPLDAQGRAQGHGRVVWRLEGLSAHDPRAWHHVYEGHLKAGRFEGAGRLRWRDGREMRGEFRAGLLHGRGLSRDAGNNTLEGQFTDGVLQGAGVYRARAGWVWRGPFVDGVMQGAGQLTEAGGRRYALTMTADTPASALPDNLAAHPLIAGLRPAQGGASMADRAEISVFVDQRLSANQWGGYESRVDGDRVIIQPSNEGMIDMWNGEPSYFVREMLSDAMEEDWTETRALTILEMATADGSRVTLDDLSLKVLESVPHLRPMLLERTHMGCEAYEPSFGFINHGWGKVENPRLRVRFAHADDVDYDDIAQTARASRWVDVNVPGFDTGVEIDLRGALASLNVPLNRLEASKFACPSAEWLLGCGKAAVDTGVFGEIAPYVSYGYSKLLTTEALAELTFDWTNYFGETETETRDYLVTVSLAYMDVRASLAECGAGGAWPTEAQQFHDVILPVGQSDYTIALPWRGNPSMSDFAYGVKFHAERTSYHRLQAQARFTDGSVRLSPEAILFFVTPRQPVVLPRHYGAACTLTIDDSGLC